jgi:DNA helicase-2/ATP-dependent DNA helicase PcrA
MDLLGEELGKQVNVHSFHSLASSQLRRYIQHVSDYQPNFQILDQDDALDLIKDLREKLNYPAWGRVLHTVPEVGSKVVGEIIRSMKQAQDPLLGFVQYMDHGTKLKNGKGRKAVYEQLAKFWNGLEQVLNTHVMHVAEAALEVYYPYMEQQYGKKGKSIEAREKDLQTLCYLYEGYDGDLQKFLEDMALDPLEEDEVQEGSKDSLVLSTIHGFKGLERKVIFVINAAEGRIPSYHAITAEEIAEEKRLFYVAMTRAMELLFITIPLWGQEKQLFPSRFLADCKPFMAQITA